MLASRLGLGEPVIGALQHAYERWDGKGLPNGTAGEAIPLEIRISSVARDIDLAVHGNRDPMVLLNQRRGKVRPEGGGHLRRHTPPLERGGRLGGALGERARPGIPCG